jgi:hypothetical protein
MFKMRFWPITARPISAMSALASMFYLVPLTTGQHYRTTLPVPEKSTKSLLKAANTPRFFAPS